MLNEICLQFANIKHRKKKFCTDLKRTPYKCQIFPDRKTLCYIVYDKVYVKNEKTKNDKIAFSTACLL